MTLKPGTQLGPYEILPAIGAGGMGEVYKARDTRLDRFVAIKVLPAHLADRTDLRERFEREAKTIASLKHPHICVLYDIGRQDGIDYLVMEYLEGETLAARLLKGPLPLEQVLRYATEIADALDKAHRQDFTHRDLKPGNIMLTKEGSKLLDFGLAKLKQEVNKKKLLDSQVPTPAPANILTVHGTLLGTLQYMAPEQVEGKTDEIDARTDIFAFGAVVYEMLTGKRAFEGKTQASLIGAILKDDPPPMSSLQPVTPPALDHAVKKCLAKDPEDRWQTARDVWHELKWIAEGSSQAVAPAPIAITAPRSRVAGWILACLLVAAITGIAVWSFTRKALPTPQITRFALTLPPGTRLADTNQPNLALSPDGSRLVYAASSGSTQQLYLRAMDSPDAKPIPGTEGATGPFFSPDGEWIGFFAGGKLKKLPLSGGAPMILADAAQPRGATWGADDTIVYAPITNAVLFRVPAGGGTPNAITAQKVDPRSRWPEFLPGGKTVVYNPGIGDASAIVALRLDTGERRVLIQGGTSPHYLPTGHLVYARAGMLMAVPFDPARLAVKGAAVQILEGVSEQSGSGAAQFSVSKSGALVYIPGGVSGSENILVWVDRKGTVQPLPAPRRAYSAPAVSPDGKRVAVEIQDSPHNVWVYDIARNTLTRLTFEGANHNPIWTPDGKRVTFGSERAGPQVLFWKPADGSGADEQLITNEYPQTAESWSHDGQLLAIGVTDPATNEDVWLLSREGDPGTPGQGRKTRPLLHTQFNEETPMISQDGHWLAYASDESGKFEIYVQPFPGLGRKWQISTEGGKEPLWSRNGKELFYRNGDKMIAVDITTNPNFSAGTSKLLFQGQYASTNNRSSYDVAPDGQRFLMVKPAEQDSSVMQISVVLNWSEELKRKAPAK